MMPPEPTFPCNGHSELRQLSFFTSRDLVDERTASSEIGLKLYHARRLGAGRQHLIAEAPRQVMSGLLPSDTPKLDGFDIAAVLEPAYEVGGDYYDFIPLGNERWGFAMADVSGKGAPAALVVAATRATLYALAKRELALRAILQRANEFINASTGPRAKYVTLFYAVLDTHARRFIYINAGHLPPIVLRGHGEVELLRSGGFPLGFFDNPRLRAVRSDGNRRSPVPVH